MLPFTVRFEAGIPPYEQVLHAVRRAVASGQLRAGDSFPSVRVLSQELRINPNTAHKIVGILVTEGVLEVRPGIGTIVTDAPPASPGQRKRLLGPAVERLVVDAKILGLDVDDVLSAIEAHWNALDRRKP